MKTCIFTILSSCVAITAALAQTYEVDFSDPTWTNSSNGGASEFQTNGSTSGNFAGWDATHSVSNVGGSGVGVSLDIDHKVTAWNIENRPSLASYFPNSFGAAGDILRSWNNTGNLSPGQIPAFTLQFSSEVKLFNFGLEGFRHDDAWRITAYDTLGQPVSPLWRNPNLASYTDPGATLGNTAINILTTNGINGATGAEALGAGRYDATNKSFIVWNANNVFERGSAILDYNGSTVQRIVFEMIEVNTATGEALGTAADQSMYLGSGLNFQTVPEPSTALLSAAAFGLLLVRRRRAE